VSGSVGEEGQPGAAQLTHVGFMGRGYHTGRLAWPKLKTKFLIGGVLGINGADGVQTHPSIERAPNNLLLNHAVDLLVVDSVQMADYKATQINPKGESKWLRQVRMATGQGIQPKIVVESWTDNSLFHEGDGPTGKRHRLLWEKAGFLTRVHRWEAEKQNSALTQERLVVFRIQNGIKMDMKWAGESPLPARAMSNMLRFRNIPRKAYVKDAAAVNKQVSEAMLHPLSPNK